ncbi:MAG: general secretion pathway protein GspK [Candidatus Binatia bacterium]
MIKNSNFRIRTSTFLDDRGVALVAVLWIFILFFVVAFDFSFLVRQEGAASTRYAEEAEGYYLAVAGFEDALYRLIMDRETNTSRIEGRENPDVQEEEALEYGVWREKPFGTGFYRVRLVDEGGKINLNLVDEATLRTIFTNLGIQEPQRGILVDSILDWRDGDDLHRLNGAEDDYYLSLSPPYTARNGRFDTIEELLWVRGVTADIFYGQGGNLTTAVGLRDIFTVEGRIKQVNLRTASAEVCHALVGIPLEECQGFVEERKILSEKTLADLLQLLGVDRGEAATRGFVFVAPTVVSVEALGSRSESASSHRLKGVIRLLGGNRGFELIRWVDRDTALSAGEGVDGSFMG